MSDLARLRQSRRALVAYVLDQGAAEVASAVRTASEAEALDDSEVVHLADMVSALRVVAADLRREVTP